MASKKTGDPDITDITPNRYRTDHRLAGGSRLASQEEALTVLLAGAMNALGDVLDEWELDELEKQYRNRATCYHNSDVPDHYLLALEAESAAAVCHYARTLSLADQAAENYREVLAHYLVKHHH